jgi:hypothetical protein
MQPPGNPGPGQDPYQQYPPGYGQAPQYSDPYSAPPYDQPSSSPYPPHPVAPQSSPPSQPAEYSLYPPISGPPPPPPPMPPPQYPMGGYSVPVMQPLPMSSNQGNTFGLLSMIFGIVSIPLLCCFYIGIPLGIAALVLGIIGNNKASRGEANNKGMAIAGIVCGGIGALLGLLWIVAIFGFNASAPSHYY